MCFLAGWGTKQVVRGGSLTCVEKLSHPPSPADRSCLSPDSEQPNTGQNKEHPVIKETRCALQAGWCDSLVYAGL